MITAAEALRLTMINLDPILEEIEQDVIRATKNGYRNIKVRKYGFADGVMLGLDYPEVNKNVMEKLKELGYKISVRSEDRQFVDIWLEVEW